MLIRSLPSRFSLTQTLGMALATLATTLVLATTAVQAQYPLQRLLQTTPTSRLEFSPYTVGSVIRGATNRIYILRATAGDRISIDVSSMGARAGVGFYDSDGNQLKRFSDIGSEADRTLDYEVPKTGDYYLVCYGGPTFHFYALTIVIE